MYQAGLLLLPRGTDLLPLPLPVPVKIYCTVTDHRFTDLLHDTDPPQ
jgi:hypothetical protein